VFELLSGGEENEAGIGKLASGKSLEKEAGEGLERLVDTSQFTRIEANIKELFQSKDVFKFSFDNVAETVVKNPSKLELV
jgi:hypothetical protein